MHSQKEIAFQAGVSLATVDRVQHARAGVRAATKARVEAAMRELDRQADRHALDGKRLALDVIIEAPARFSTAVCDAFEAELEGLRPASLRLRFHLVERFETADLLALLRQIRRRGTHGIIAKLPDTALVHAEMTRCQKARIPLVSFVTDLNVSGRAAYIGMDNVAAGRIAAYLVGKAGGAETVLVSLSSRGFAGEVERVRAFEAALADRRVIVVAGGMGRPEETKRLVREAAAGHKISAVYSAGGANEAILAALPMRPDLYVGHDLDRDNRALLVEGRIDFVIHHDLRVDARHACQHILKAHRLLPQDYAIAGSAIQLATPFNM
ncbi:LacI family DNA-binding transcriptional regulator [Litoreibacter sp.]|nr:LacI family DNA-binding transcriptional regulator [Litoreibacter sp.]